MSTKTIRSLLVALGLSALAAAPAPLTSADETAAAFQSIHDKVGPALVTIKCILKIEGAGEMSNAFGGDEGRELEFSGLMIEPSGLVLTSNTYIGGALSKMRGLTANASAIKVLIGDDSEGLSAKVLARDSDLDLAWMQIDDPKAAGKTFDYSDLSGSASPAIGDQLLGVTRMGKFFDHALVINEGRLGGSTKKPRALLIPTDLAPELGMPVFDKAGKPVGVFILQTPNREDMEGGDNDGMRGSTQVLILGADEVVKATARGKEVAAQNPTPDADSKPASGESKEAKPDPAPVPTPDKK